MKIYLSTLILLCTSCCTHLLSQNTINSFYNSNASDNTFEYQGELYQFADMNEIFEQDVDAHNMYISAINNRKKVKNLGYAALSTIGLATLAIALDRPDPGDLIGITAGNLIGVLALVFVLPATGIAALINKKKFHNKKHKAIHLFNNPSDTGYLNNQEHWNLKIGSGQYGYGMVVTF